MIFTWRHTTSSRLASGWERGALSYCWWKETLINTLLAYNVKIPIMNEGKKKLHTL